MSVLRTDALTAKLPRTLLTSEIQPTIYQVAEELMWLGILMHIAAAITLQIPLTRHCTTVLLALAYDAHIQVMNVLRSM